MTPLLQVKNLRIELHPGFYPVKNVNFSLNAGETLALVGESGSGKSITAFTVMGLLGTRPGFIPGRIVSGHIFFENEEFTNATESQWRQIRGKRIALINQEPMASLNPLFSINFQIREVLTTHFPEMSPSEKDKRVLDLLDIVGIQNPDKMKSLYPHQYSGGMRQRVAIAMALAAKPSILIADEPTTALDASLRHTILNLLKDIQRQYQMGVLLISHDLGMVEKNADSVGIMLHGEIIEINRTAQIFQNPQHPYTKALLKVSSALKTATFQATLPTVADESLI